MNRRREGFFGAAILVVILLLALVVSLGQEAREVERDGSVASTNPRGRRALMLLLRETGFDARSCRDAPRDLPRESGLVWLPRAPEATMPEASDRRMRSGSTGRIGLHDLRHYRSFVERGGTLVLAAGEETRDFLVQTLGIEEASGLRVDESSDDRIEHVRTSNGDLVEMDVAAAGAFEPLPVSGSARALWTVERDASTAPFAVEFPSGAGSVVVVARDAFVENRYIGEREHAVAAVRLVEDLSRGGPVLFSEYELGRFEPPSTWSLLFGPNLFLATLHGFLLLGLFTWMHAFARGFPRDPEPLALFSPYLRARSLADVFVRARRRDTLALLLQRGAFARFHAIARLRPRRNERDVKPGPALQPITRAEVSSFAREAGVADLESTLVGLLQPRVGGNERASTKLDQDLRSLERELERRLHERAAAPAAETAIPR